MGLPRARNNPSFEKVKIIIGHGSMIKFSWFTDQCRNLMNLRRVSNPLKDWFQLSAGLNLEN